MQNCSCWSLECSRPKLINISWEIPSLLAQRPKVLLNEIGVETIVTGGNRSVGGEDHFAGNLSGSKLKTEALFLHAIANRLEDGETAVSLVEVENTGRNSHGFESAEAADTKQQLLTNAGATVATVEA